jgi:O-antigen/teichoic acid export membrane protein
MSNIITAIASRRMFPAYKPEGRLEELEVKKINKRIADLFTSKIGAVVVNSVDTIVISAFLGLSMLGIYQNYFFIMTSIIGMIEIIFNACTAGIGNSVIVESGEKNYNDLKKFTFIISWISGFCVCCFACLYQPFMELWVGKKLMLNFSAVVCLCIYFYIYEINRLLNTYKDAAGIWHADRFRPLATAGANLTLNLIMVQFWGIYGIILSTVLSMLIVGMPWLIQNLFSTIFQRDLLKSYVAQLLRYVFIVAVISSITYILSDFVRGQLVFQLIVKGIICVAVPNVCFWMIYKNKKEYAEMLIIIERMTHGKIRFRRASK